MNNTYSIIIHDDRPVYESQTRAKISTAQSMPTKAKANTAAASSGDSAATAAAASGAAGAAASGAKFGVVAAIVAAVVKTAYDIAIFAADNAVPWVANESGDYTHTMQYNDYKSSISQITSPLRAIIDTQHRMQAMRLLNERLAQNRRLIGGSLDNFLNRPL